MVLILLQILLAMLSKHWVKTLEFPLVLSSTVGEQFSTCLTLLVSYLGFLVVSSVGYISIEYVVFLDENENAKLWAVDLKLQLTDNALAHRMFEVLQKVV